MKTPYFIIKTNKIDSLVNKLLSSLQYKWPNAIAGYSFKTNNLPWIISYFKRLGFYAEVVSSDEYHLAKELGYAPNKIIFNGPVKEKKDFLKAVENGAIVNIDSKRELCWLSELNKKKFVKSNIGLRVNFCLENFCPGESQCGDKDGRFGLSYEKNELSDAITFLKNNSIPLSGLHLHCSSKTRSLKIYDAISQMACKIAEEYDLNLKFIDVGGGFFGGVEGKPTFDDYFNVIYDNFKSNEKLKDVNIVVEPGISVIGAGVDYVTTVLDTKETLNNKFTLLDGSRIHIDPFKRKTGYSYHIERQSKQFKSSTVSQILCGFTCMEDDRFFELNDSPLEIGDRVIFEKVGAYTMGLSPQFIQFYPPVYAETEKGVLLVRKKNTAKHFKKGSYHL